MADKTHSFLCCHPTRGVCKVYLLSLHTFPYNKWCCGIINKKLQLLKCLNGTPPSCRSDPENPLHAVRALAMMAPSTGIAPFQVL